VHITTTVGCERCCGVVKSCYVLFYVFSQLTLNVVTESVPIVRSYAQDNEEALVNVFEIVGSRARKVRVHIRYAHRMVHLRV